MAIVTCELEFLLDQDSRMNFMLQLASHEDQGPRDTLSIAALRADGAAGEEPLWYRILETRPVDDLPEVSVTADSSKFYRKPNVAWTTNKFNKVSLMCAPVAPLQNIVCPGRPLVL